ncbi:hypothetical protein ARMGADRAFT_1129647, partial [Armillaria gallica]
ALLRDKFQCVVSGKYDQDTLSEVSAPTDEIWKAGVVYIQCAHMAPESTNLNDSSNKKVRAPHRLTVLKSFCYAIEQLSGNHSLSNIITMQFDVHEWFTRLEIWFEKMPTPPYPSNLTNSPPQTTRTSPFHPSLHATCLKVAQFFHVAEDIDKQDEDLGVLAEDGSSAEVLSGALLRSMDQPMRLVLNLKLFPIPISQTASFPTRPDLPLFRPRIPIPSSLQLAFSSAVANTSGLSSSRA